MKKRWSFILSCIAAFTLMVGCANKSESPGASSDDGQQTPPDPEQKYSLTLMTWQGSGAPQKVWDDLNAKFNEAHPNITVVNEPMDSKQYSQVYKARVVSGEGPDIMSVYPADLESFVQAGYIAPLDDLAALKKLERLNLDQYKVDGKLYAIPLAIGGTGILYNKEIFSRLNLDVPRTWSELIEVSEKIKENGIVPFGMTVKDSWFTQFFIYPLTKAPVQAKDPDVYYKIAKGEMKFGDTAISEAFEKFLLFRDKGFFSKDALGINFDQAKAEFAQGKSAMFVGTDWLLSDIRAINPEFELGYMDFPASDDATENEKVGWGGYSMSLSVKSGKTKEAAKQYLDWLFTQENYQSFVNGIKWFPVLEGIDVSSIDPLANAMSDSFVGMTMYPSDNDVWLSGVADTMLKSIQEAYLNQKTATDIVKDMDESNERALKAK